MKEKHDRIGAPVGILPTKPHLAKGLNMSHLTNLRQTMDEDTVASLPLREPIQIVPATIVRAAVAMMRHRQLGCAVIAERGRPMGIFTERSVLDVLIQDASLDNLPVRNFADINFRCVQLGDPISCVWDAIQRDGLRFICVTREDGQLVGLTGQRGLAEYVAECFPQHVMGQRFGPAWLAEREGA